MPRPAYPRSRTLREVRLLMELAETYQRDGAWLTAADRLRKAADLCQAEHEAREAYLREGRE